MITEFFDTWFACDGTLYTYIDNVVVSPSITLCSILLCSFWVPYHESKVPTGSVSTNLGLPERIDFQKSHLVISRKKICEAQSQQQVFCLLVQM